MARMKLTVGTAIAVVLAFVIANSHFSTHAQSSVPDAKEQLQPKTMAFDVASIKRHPYDPSSPAYTPHANFPLIAAAPYTPKGGLLLAENMPVNSYVSFAYKLSPGDAVQLVYPKWVPKEHFDIEAHGPADTTGEQMRLMMQSLLADRFRLKVHWENRQVPGYSAVLAKHGEPGPSLQQYSGAQCAAGSKLPVNAKFAEGTCGQAGMKYLPNGQNEVTGRSVPIQKIAAELPHWPGVEIDRPVVDATGLTGLFDYDLTWVPESRSGDTQTVDSQGPTFVEALRDQLGIKLQSANVTIQIFVIDHIEEPSAN